MDTVCSYISQHSYWAIVLGVILEGDLTLLAAGMLAHEGLLNFGYTAAFLAAMGGAVLGDLLAFLFGRRVRYSLSDTRFYRKFHPRMEWLDLRFGGLSIILVKYIYGLRFASSIFWGMSRMGLLRFGILTGASCVVWVSMMTGLGWLFGVAITQFIADVHTRFHRLAVALLVAAVAALLLYIVHHWWLSPKLQQAAEQAGLTRGLDPYDPGLPPERPETPEDGEPPSNKKTDPLARERAS